VKSSELPWGQPSGACGKEFSRLTGLVSVKV
jgi:hypothetical protein